MDKRDWEILVVLDEERNMTKSAEKLYISQPALSKRIQQLEIEFGISIVERHKKGVIFTPAGEILVEYAKRMLIEELKLTDMLASFSEEMSGTLRLGMSSFITRQIPPVLKKFKEQYEQVNFDITTGLSNKVYQQLMNDEIQIAFIRGQYEWTERKFVFLKENLVLISDVPIVLEDLPNRPRIDYDCEPMLRAQIDHWWGQNFSVSPRVDNHVDKSDTSIIMAANGLGYTIVPSLVVKHEEQLHKLILTDEYNQAIERESWLMYREKTLENPVVAAFIEFLQRINFQDYI